MATNDSTAIPDPAPESQAGGSPTVGPAALSPARLAYWSVLRELWEHRWLYIVPLIVAAVFLVGFVLGAARPPLHQIGTSPPVPPTHSLQGPYDFASFIMMLAYIIIAVIYCVGALHGERSDRSILFWKSLPVSDLTTVIAKASMAIIVLPLVIFVILAVTQGLTFLIAHAVMLVKGANAAVLWTQAPLLPMWAAVLYHLLTVHSLYYAPFYGWLLLVSGWARRATFLWAILPIAAILVVEKLVFNTSVFGHLLLSRLLGGPAAVPFPFRDHMGMQMPPTLANVAAFLASPGLWIGLAVFAVFLAAAVWLRRRQGPI